MGQQCRGSDFVFPVPDTWVERSMIGFSAPPVSDRAVSPNILVSVAEIPAEEQLANFVDRQVEDLGRSAEQFRLSLRRDVRLDGAEGVEIVFSWMGGEQGLIKQRQVYARRTVKKVLSVTHTAREQDFAACDSLFLDMLRDFAWTDIDAP